MQITTNQILKFLYVLSWIIFIGVCVEAGGILFNTISTLVWYRTGSSYFWNGVDMSSLYNYDHGYFFQTASIMVIIAIIKAWMFYLIVKILRIRN